MARLRGGRALAAATVGAAVAVAALAIAPAALRGLADRQAGAMVALDGETGEGTFGYRAWAGGVPADEALAEMWLKGYYFNIENPEGVMRGDKPLLREMGPYHWVWHREQRDVAWRKDDSGERHVRYRTYEHYSLDPSRSVPGAHADDNVTTVNAAILAALSLAGPIAGQLSPAEELVVAELVSELQRRFPKGFTDLLFVNRTVAQLAFGFDDPLIAQLLATIPMISSLLPLGAGIPGLSGHANMTEIPTEESEDMSEQDAGLPHAKGVGNYTMWKGYESIKCCASLPCNADTQVPVWPTPEQNQVTGSDGTMFGPGVRSTDELVVWAEEVNRSSTLVNVDGERSDVDGVPTLRFTIKHDDYLSAQVYPANARWFAYGPSGVMNATRCGLGLPLFLSKPHFLDVQGAFNGTELGGGDAPLLSRIHGDVMPDRALHDTMLDVEPTSGATLNGLQRLQANVWLDAKVLATGRTKNVTLFEDISPALVPLMWLEKGGVATPLALKQVKKNLRLLKAATVVLTTTGVLGCVLCAAGLASVGRLVWRALLAPCEERVENEASEALLDSVENSPQTRGSGGGGHA